MPFPRFAIRRLMVVVAVFTCLLWAGITGMRKSRRYRALESEFDCPLWAD